MNLSWILCAIIGHRWVWYFTDGVCVIKHGKCLRCNKAENAPSPFIKEDFLI